ncbi:MAG: inositol monophosphatase family protein, partial [Chloroflexi bacterium]|nr:inositol monophosphatase family protein [Chloroflexota bacterium]
TEVDTEAENAVKELLSKEYPQIPILGEESSGDPAAPRPDQAGWLWIVDPLDGTRKYASDIPHFSTVVALALDGEVVVGVNHDPVRDELFLAEQGKGAYLNGERIRISSRKDLESSVLGMDLSYVDQGAAQSLDMVQKIWPGVQTVRIMGSAALGLSWAAAGRTDLFLHYQLAPWDQAAGILLVEEAGGVVVDRMGNRAGLSSEGILATNRDILRDFMQKTDGHPWHEPARRLA